MKLGPRATASLGDVVRVSGEAKTSAELVTQVKTKDFRKEVHILKTASGWMKPATYAEHQRKAAELAPAVPLAERKRLLVPGIKAKLAQLASLREAVRIMRMCHEAWLRNQDEVLDLVTKLFYRSEPLDLGRLNVLEHKIQELEVEVGERRR